MHIEPFKVEIDQAILDDLVGRLKHTRWPDEVSNDDWRYGANRAYMQNLAAYWQSGFDWRSQERAINAFPHFRAEIDGLHIHFIHQRGSGPRPLPIVITHGWPGSFYEMHKIIPLLADPVAHGGDPADAFDVIVPSMPGYGFSDAPRSPGLITVDIAQMWTRLLTEGLGYERFAAHGGDIGSSVTAQLGLRHRDRVLGIHVTAIRKPYLGPGSAPLSEAEKAFIALNERWEADEGAYGHQQGTRPQTLGYGLNDSPVGLASWIVEKFRAWGDCHGNVESRFSRDELLTNVMIYWATQTITSSMRLYYESRHVPHGFGPKDRIEVSCAIALSREEVELAPREWAERTYNVQRWVEFPSGGHFMALEEPELLVEDIRAFFRGLR